jgi:hypothetical protein
MFISPQLDTPFSSDEKLSAAELYEAFAGTPQPTVPSVTGYFFRADTEAISEVLTALWPPFGAPAPLPGGRDAVQVYTFVTENSDVYAQLAGAVEPEDLECCVVVYADPSALSLSNAPTSAFLGTVTQAIVQEYVNGEADYTSGVMSSPVLLGVDLADLASGARMEWEGLSPVALLMSMVGGFNSKAASKAKDIEAPPSVVASFASYTGLHSKLRELVLSYFSEALETEKPEIDAATARAGEQLVLQAFAIVEEELASLAGLIPDVDGAIGKYLEQFLLELADSDAIKFVVALQKFEAAYYGRLLSIESLSDVVRDNFQGVLDNQQRVFDQLSAGAFLMPAAFAAGTVYQIVYDILNVFYMVIKYSFHGLAHFFERAVESVTSSEEKYEGPSASSSAIEELFAGFDVADAAAFLEDDAPELLVALQGIVSELISKFSENATSYGEAAADYTADLLGKTASTGIDLLYEPYDPEATLLERAWNVAKQSFRLGTIFGPLTVDLALMFGTGGASTPITAVVKLGKIDDIADAMRFATRAPRVLANTKAAKAVKAIIDNDKYKSFSVTAQRIVSRLAAAVQGPRERILDAIESLQTAGKLPTTFDKDEMARALELAYETCSTVDLFVSVFLMMSSTSKINTDGTIGTENG